VPELPSGIVTFLFTDVEGSTQHQRRLREQWAHAHATQRRLLRAAVGDVGGSEVDAQGDSFFAAFAGARSALSAAAEAQRALHQEEWPGDAEVRIRMGIHTGEPILGEEGYLGLAVVRAARICAVARGGQVLVSEATRALVRDDAPEGIELEDTGEHVLKDFDEPERLFQIVAPGLPLARAASPPELGRGSELAMRALAATGDLDAIGAAIEREVQDMLSRAGIEAAVRLTPKPTGS
jgi:class 3 adenylate cyclase